MAEGTSVNLNDNVSSIPPTPDLEDRCRVSTRRMPSGNVCRYYQQGRCLFGDRCWNSHQSKSELTTVRCERHSAGPSRQYLDSVESPRKTNLNMKDSYEPKYSFLHKNTRQKKEVTLSNPPNWVNAPEFVPQTTRSYADTVKCSSNLPDVKFTNIELCPYFIHGDCPFDNLCSYVHGDVCELCGKACLDPYDAKQRKMHTEFCEKELEQDMELSFAIQRSLGKACGICMDIIMEKEPISERRFGILENCKHIFCLSCIRKWRKVKSFESSNNIDNILDPIVTRACPECRVASDFITPSQYWVDTEEEKKKLISEYKIALSKKPCKYFKQGKGTCPFAGACFYLHAKPDGTKVDLPPPARRRRQNQDGELDFMGRIFLWDYLELREDNILMQLELEDYMYAISDASDEESNTTEASDNLFLSF